MRRRLLLAAPALLAGCGTSRPKPPAPSATGGGGAWSCVPYARAHSAIQLGGDAWEWWEAAAGRYGRGRDPRPGSVLVLLRTSRLRQGHVAVVRKVAGPREIRVDHANWASGAGKGQVARDQPVEDVSAPGDWSLVRVWYPPRGDFGATSYPTYGFIHATAA